MRISECRMRIYNRSFEPISIIQDLYPKFKIFNPNSLSLRHALIPGSKFLVNFRYHANTFLLVTVQLNEYSSLGGDIHGFTIGCPRIFIGMDILWGTQKTSLFTIC